VSDQAFADAMMASLMAAVRRLSAAGLSSGEIADLINRRLAGPIDTVAAEAAIRELADEGFPGDGPGKPGPNPAEAAPARGQEAPAMPLPTTPGWEHDPSGYPVGTVVTDTRSRPCLLEEDGWHRPGTPGVLSWAEVIDAKGGYEMAESAPGTPTVVFRPQERAEVRTTVHYGAPFDVVVQKAILGADGQPLAGPDGNPVIRGETESVVIGEIVPDP
jgi:hypothetical protein